MEDEEALKAGAVVGNLADAVEDLVDDLLANGVVTAGVVVGCVLLSGNYLFGVVQLTVGAGADLVTDGGLEVDVDSTRNVTALAGLGEEGGAGIVSGLLAAFAGHLTGRVDAMFNYNMMKIDGRRIKKKSRCKRSGVVSSGSEPYEKHNMVRVQNRQSAKSHLEREQGRCAGRR